MAKLHDRPSDQFVAAIIHGFRLEHVGKGVPLANIWDQVVRQCLHVKNGFRDMFAWDSRPGRQNRIRTIEEIIEAGYVAGLVVRDGKVYREGEGDAE